MMKYLNEQLFEIELRNNINDKKAYLVYGEFNKVPKFYEDWSALITPKDYEVYYQFVVNGDKESLFEIWEGGSYEKNSGYIVSCINMNINGEKEYKSVLMSGLKGVSLQGSTRISFNSVENNILCKGTGRKPVMILLKPNTLYLFHSFSFEEDNNIKFRAEFFEKYIEKVIK